MTKIEANVPDYLRSRRSPPRRVRKLPLEPDHRAGLVSPTRRMEGSDDMATRAKRANLADFDRIMAKVPDVPPLPATIAEGLQRTSKLRSAHAGEKSDKQ